MVGSSAAARESAERRHHAGVRADAEVGVVLRRIGDRSPVVGAGTQASGAALPITNADKGQDLSHIRTLLLKFALRPPTFRRSNHQRGATARDCSAARMNSLA